jgi:putative DNA primase/helicase
MSPLTPDAKEAWVAFHDAIESGLASGGELFDIRDVASKTADNAARLAALFQVFNHGGGAVGLDAFESAARITAWHLSEARRFFGGLALPQEMADAARLDSWMVEYCHREKTSIVPVSKMQQCGPSGLRAKLAIEAALGELTELERVRCVKDGKRRMVHINPALLADAL